MIYSKEFTTLIERAAHKTKDFYSDNPETVCNPFYVGFGNPNSDILLIGKEKAIGSENSEALKYESIQNPIEWKHNVTNRIPYNRNKVNKEAEHYLSCFYPYKKKNKGGDTWAKYESLVNSILEKKRINHNDFFEDSFLTEVNYKPSKWSKIRTFDNEERKTFLKSSFYRSFKITILACADYLNRREIEEIFDVKFDKNLSGGHKLVVYKNKKRILVNTRQLSTSVPNLYLQEIAGEVKTYL